MAEKIGDQFRGLPMGELIGGPLMSACDAQVRLANATADFIKMVGFLPPAEGDKSGNQAVRTATFKFTRPAAGAAAEPGKPLPTEDVTLDVPLLAIVKVPALGIKTVDISFDMEVKNSETSKESTDTKGEFSVDAQAGWGPFSVKVHIAGSVSAHKENTRSSDQSAKYHVALHAADDGMPEGLARVLDIMNSAIAPKTITQNAAQA